MGCGGGYISRLLVKKGFRVIGVDISGNVVKLARKNVPGAKFYKMDMRKLKFGAGSFDGITSFYAIIHVPRKYHLLVLKEFSTLLKPGGFLLLTMSGTAFG